MNSENVEYCSPTATAWERREGIESYHDNWFSIYSIVLSIIPTNPNTASWPCGVYIARESCSAIQVQYFTSEQGAGSTQLQCCCGDYASMPRIETQSVENMSGVWFWCSVIGQFVEKQHVHLVANLIDNTGLIETKCKQLRVQEKINLHSSATAV